MPRNYNRDEEDYSVTRPVRHQRSRASGDFDDSDQEETSYRRRSVQQRYRDHSDSEGDDDRPIQEQRRGKSRFDEMEVRKPRRQPERDSSFVPRTLQPSENRIRTSTSSSSAWSESHKDNWAEKENFRADEYSKPKPWARATETGDRSNPFKKSSRFADEDEDFAGHTPVEEYVEPVRRNKARPPPPKSQYQPYHLREEDDVTAPSANENPASPSSLHSKDETHFNDTDEVNDQDSTSNQSLPTDDDDASPPTNYLEQYPSKNPPHPSAFSQNGGCKYGLPFTVPFIHLCPLKGENSSLVQCLIVRNREDLGNKLYPTYSLYLEDKNKLLIVAKKMSFNSTSNYHLFDMSRGSVHKSSSKMTKKSGNYLGKLRAADSNRSEYTIVTASTAERKEIGAIVFDRNGIVNQLKEGCQPRKMYVKVPEISSENTPIEHSVTKSIGNKQISMIDLLKLSDPNFIYSSKDPVFERGNYRLNFGGRVTKASVKNFQLASPAEPDNVICQFGKVADDKFHLDYKTPLNAFQAFCLALCHFDT
jgi:hypothetical protein